ncbi:methyltransferase domain-containing protein [Candidatus Pacearchaeota archaeon]|nr:methyltransferase domain-containing protein [Candidatus Pacearchaeota archaeon]
MKKDIFRAYDILGNLAIVKFSDKVKLKDKKKFADKILKNNKSIKTILEKTGKFKGRLRIMQTKYLLGEKTKEVLYRENGCSFRFSIDETYFSPRLSNERKEIASMIKKNNSVLVMFAGVAPFSIIIAKNSKAKKVVSNEINRKANKYAQLNIELNKLKNKVELASGDIKKVAPKLKEKFDVIVMPRPQLKNSFLEQAFKLSKKGTRIYYYDFCKIDEVPRIEEKIKKEAKKFRKKIKILNSKIAGEVGPYKIRVRVDLLID